MNTNRTDDPFLLDPAVTPVYRGIYAAITLLFILVGFSGNLIVCLAVSRVRRFRNTINLLIANLAVADILQCGNIISLFVTLVKGKWVFGTFLCNVNAFLMIGLVTASVYSLVAIAVNRYVIIHHCDRYPKTFSRKRTKLMIAAVWLIACASALPPVFGWGVYTFASRRGFCILDFYGSTSYVITMSTTILLVPFLVIALAYCRIFLAIHKSKRKVGKIHPSMEETPSEQSVTARRSRTQKLEAFSLSVMLFVVTFLFVVIYVPTMVFNFLEMIGTGTPNVGIDLGFVLLALSNHIINPFVYGIMNKNYRTSIHLVIRNCFR
uniref:Biogenic amine-like GPCR n=1 Tax=Tripedalia cystophora TaxID=6141 RepID=A0A481ZN98_TRICY|nr:biogenic amine-like GPCR [Tripedalia cystophora]